MTRINCIPPEELTDKHLVAEHHELPRVLTLAHKAMLRGEDPVKIARALPTYRLGAGHVRFFYPRLGYLAGRYDMLKLEMSKRGFKSGMPRLWGLLELPPRWWQRWTPTPEAQEENRARIRERLK